MAQESELAAQKARLAEDFGKKEATAFVNGWPHPAAPSLYESSTRRGSPRFTASATGCSAPIPSPRGSTRAFGSSTTRRHGFSSARPLSEL